MELVSPALALSPSARLDFPIASALKPIAVAFSAASLSAPIAIAFAALARDSLPKARLSVPLAALSRPTAMALAADATLLAPSAIEYSFEALA